MKIVKVLVESQFVVFRNEIRLHIYAIAKATPPSVEE
jgi:hypothetical protein